MLIHKYTRELMQALLPLQARHSTLKISPNTEILTNNKVVVIDLEDYENTTPDRKTILDMMADVQVAIDLMLACTNRKVRSSL